MKIAWHYWCGHSEYTREKFGDKYVKFLCISVESLINNGNVDPKDIYITIDSLFLNETKYGRYLQSLNLNFLDVPLYRNYSKQIAYYNLLNKYPDLDRIAQIDCDTYVTIPNASEVIKSMSGPINMDYAHDKTVDNLIRHRNGQLFGNNACFGINRHTLRKCRYHSFRDFLKIAHDIDLDTLLDMAERKPAPCGFFYVLHPKELPEEFFKFLSIFNFFFQDDEIAIALAEVYFDIKVPIETRAQVRDIKFGASVIEEIKTTKNKIVHFPNKDNEIIHEMTRWADKIITQ